MKCGKYIDQSRKSTSKQWPETYCLDTESFGLSGSFRVRNGGHHSTQATATLTTQHLRARQLSRLPYEVDQACPWWHIRTNCWNTVINIMHNLIIERQAKHSWTLNYPPSSNAPKRCIYGNRVFRHTTFVITYLSYYSNIFKMLTWQQYISWNNYQYFIRHHIHFNLWHGHGKPLVSLIISFVYGILQNKISTYHQ